MLKELKKDTDTDKKEKKTENAVVQEFVEEANKFKEISQKIPKKGQGREEMCWDKLQKFRNQLNTSKKSDEKETETTNFKTAWLTHKMQCTGDDEIVLARDANIRNEEDWYTIYDPRNPINKRRREEA